MPRQTKIFRVFVGSTFTDMKEERSILQKEVFPKLERYCEKNGSKFEAVDLRWGVNEESSLNQKTLQICFNEIARCQRISPKPNFLILLGDKYGWQPVPEIIPSEEMMAIKKVLPGEDVKLLDTWYLCDENASPAEFVLRPKNEPYKDYCNWAPVEAEIRTSLRNAVDKLHFNNDQRVKYFCSATHQEIIRGALNKPETGKDPKEHVLSFIRKINGLPVDDSTKGFIDMINGEQDDYCKSKLMDLKSELRSSFGKNCIEYTTNWKNSQSEMSEEKQREFKEKAFTFLKDIIETQISSAIDQDEITREIVLHKEFEECLTKHFKGRDAILKTIQEYLENGKEKRAMSLIGASGSGKSSVMAQAAKINEKDKIVLVYRFIGTTSRSSNIISLLQSISLQIAREYGIDAKYLAHDGDERAWYDMNGLSDILRKCLALATAEKPILLFLDSLDQLSETDNAKALYWLPSELPDHARLVVSSLPELEVRLNATKTEYLDVLSEEEAKEIFKKWFQSINRNLTDEQHDLVINCFNRTKLPIYLKLAFENAKHWHSYDTQHHLKEDVSGIINDYFNDLEKEHDKDFVRNAICYLLSGRHQGLGENEILEVLAFDPDYWDLFLRKNEYHAQELRDLKYELEKQNDGQKGYMKIPIAVWSRLYLDLEPFLTERDADGVPIITFFHRQFNEVLRERYELPNQIIHQ